MKLFPQPTYTMGETIFYIEHEREDTALLIHTVGKASIDDLLSQIVERYEAKFPGRVRGYYLTGSYAEGNAVEGSDIDLYVLFKGAFLSEEEAAEAQEMTLSFAQLTPIRLDITARSEELHESLRSYVRVAIKQNSRLLYGEDTRESMNLPAREEYVRDATDAALEFLLRQRETDVLTYPLNYPDPAGAFFGYDQPQRLLQDPTDVRQGIRLLVESACRIATALLALQTQSYISTKWESVQTYRSLINDEWTPFLEAMFEKGKMQWGYYLPKSEEERVELRVLCAQMPSFENSYLLHYRAYLLSLLRSPESEARQFALQRFNQMRYSDEEVVTAVQALESTKEPQEFTE